MRKQLNLTDFARKGINSDLMPWDLPGDFLTEISNIRISKLKLSPFGGSNTWAQLPADLSVGMIMPVITPSANFWLLAATDSVYVYNGANFNNISSAGGYVGVNDEDAWTGCSLTRIPIINNPNHYPEYWSPQNTGQLMQPLNWDAVNTWQAAGQACTIMRSHKQFLFALGLNINGTEVPDGVRWSSPADITGIPETWDELDTTNFAGLTTLGGEGGSIVDGLSLRDSFVVYREKGISVFDYIGGNFVWQIRNLDSSVGLLSRNSIANVRGVHYFISDGDIYRNDGNSIQSIIHNRLRQRFSSNIDPDNYKNSYVVANHQANEVWFCVPEVGFIYPNIAYIYNVEDDSWSIRDIPEAAMAGYGPKSNPQETWEDLAESWNGNQEVWSQRSLSPLNDTVILATKPQDVGLSGNLLTLDEGLTGSSEVFSSNIERLGFALEGLNKVTTITTVFPHVRGNGTLFIRFGSQDYPGSPVRWKDAIEFDPSTDRKIDVRTTGELHCFRIFSDENQYWEFSSMDIEYVLAGVR